MSESLSGDRLLMGEVTWASPRRPEALLDELRAKARRLPLAAGREVVPTLWLRDTEDDAGADVPSPADVLDALR